MKTPNNSVLLKLKSSVKFSQNQNPWLMSKFVEVDTTNTIKTTSKTWSNCKKNVNSIPHTNLM